MLQQQGRKAVYIAPLKALARERMGDWARRLGPLGITVVELTGDVTPDMELVRRASVIITTPEKWDGVSRHWKQRRYVREVGLVIIDEIHLLGLERGPVLEVIVSRMRYLSSILSQPIRFVGLSTALANAHDIGTWLGTESYGVYNFKPAIRPVPCTVHVLGFPEKHYCPRMATMNKPAYQHIKTHSPDKPVLVFVSSRRQTRLTALDLIALCAADDNSFLNMEEEALLRAVERATDKHLKNVLAFGVGMHHAGLVESDRQLVEGLFCKGNIQVLVTTSTLAWGVNFPAHLVIVKGTEYYDGNLQRYVDFPITDLLQMIGRAGRPQFDSTAVACVFVHEPKKSFYVRFLYEPFPVESFLHKHLPDHFNAEVAGGTVTTRDDAFDYLSWTYFFRRLCANPGFYDPQQNDDEEDVVVVDESFVSVEAVAKASAREGVAESHALLDRRRKRTVRYLETLINDTIDELCQSGCIVTRRSDEPDDVSLYLVPTRLGEIASDYYLCHRSMRIMSDRMRAGAMGPVDVTRLLSRVAEYDLLPVRHNEDKINAELAELCPLPLDDADAMESPHTKAFLLLQCQIFGIPLPIADYATDLKSVLDQSIRILQAMADVAAEEAQLGTALSVCRCLQSLTQGSHALRDPLYTFPELGDREVEQIGKELSLVEILESSDRVARLTSLGKLSRRTIEHINSLMGRLPLLRVSCEVAGENGETIATGDDGVTEVEAGMTLELRANLTYINEPQESMAMSKFPKTRKIGWWCFLADPEIGELISIRRAVFKKQSAVRFKFVVPDEVGQCSLSLLTCSDCYVGLDQEKDITFKVALKKVGEGSESTLGCVGQNQKQFND
eukprot:Polyplicarium_translucidae@DN2367_c0_g1_i1.p1